MFSPQIDKYRFRAGLKGDTQTKDKGGPASRHCACIISLNKNAVARAILLGLKNVTKGGSITF